MYTEHSGDQVDVIKCPKGKYSTTLGSQSVNDCKICPKGYYCPEGTGDPTLYICPQGYYCKEGSHLPTPCPEHTYSPSRGGGDLTVCRDCPIGL